jgi:hypothetical protein
VLGRALCSLGEWDDALSEIESVKDEVPPFQVGMAIAPLVVIALARGEDERVRELVAEHDRRCSDAGASVFESDFRSLRAMVLDPKSDRDGRTPPAEIITGAQVADYAEWAGWLGPVVDRVLADPGREQLVVALEALRGPGAMKRFPPVLAQAERLDAHLAMRAGEPVRAAECWMRAESLAGACGLVFETAVIALERGEHGADPEGAALTRARATFERLGAAPWLTRALQAGAGSAPAG